MKFGINCNQALGPATTAEDVLCSATQGEELDFHSFGVSDHVVIPFDHIEMFYNSRRLHSYLDYQSPNDYEAKFGAADGRLTEARAA